MSLALHDLRRPLLVLALALPAWALLRLYQRRRDLSEKELQDYSALQVGARKFERPSHEQRVARGCIGNSFVAETKKLTLEYNWNPDKSVLFGTVYIFSSFSLFFFFFYNTISLYYHILHNNEHCEIYFAFISIFSYNFCHVVFDSQYCSATNVKGHQDQPMEGQLLLF